MTLEPNHVSSFCLRFTAPCPFAGDLAPVLARGLGLSPAEVRTTQGGTGVLFPMSRVRPERAAALARAFGLETAEAERTALVSLAFLPRPGADLGALSGWLAGVTALAVERVRSALRVPGGVQVHDLPEAVAQDWGRACRGRRDLETVVSVGSVAVFDLFGPVSGALAADLRRLGLAPCGLTSAQAAGIGAETARWLERRHGIRPLDRAFQRFDLVMTGTGRLAPREAADFLCPRTGLGPADLAAASVLRPVRIEAGLARDLALRFLADYRQIGLTVALRLAQVHDA